MNFDMERKEKAEKIEAVIGTYLPKEGRRPGGRTFYGFYRNGSYLFSGA